MQMNFNWNTITYCRESGDFLFKLSEISYVLDALYQAQWFMVHDLSSCAFIDSRDGVEVERLPRMWEIRVRSPVATDLNRKKR